MNPITGNQFFSFSALQSQQQQQFHQKDINFYSICQMSTEFNKNEHEHELFSPFIFFKHHENENPNDFLIESICKGKASSVDNQCDVCQVQCE